ncbi:MAG: hypothetical protein ABI852_05765 [Gemmatimonadaceae bacterium]
MKIHRATLLRSIRLHCLALATSVAGVSLMAGCSELDPDICGSDSVYACAQLQTFIQADSIMLPPSHMVGVKITPARTDASWDGTVAPVPTIGSSQVNFYFHLPLTPTSDDTVTVWIVAQLLELPIPPSTDVPFKTVAVDSIKHVLRVARRGARIVPDTIQLRLRKFSMN